MKPHDLDGVGRALSRLVDGLVGSFQRSEQRHWCKLYLSGLLLDGERKSVEPMARRIEGGNVQAMQQFVNQSPWDHRDLMAELRRFVAPKLSLEDGVLILDDVSLPKKGRHSVGVAHQYCGALGKTSNCQSIVSWQYVVRNLHVPLIARLYLPLSWVEDPARMSGAGVPERERIFKEKWRIALDLLDEIKDERRFRAVTFDADYGRNRLFLAELDRRNVRFVGQTACDETFWDGDVKVDSSLRHKKGPGRPRHYRHIADRRLRPKSTAEWAKLLFSDPASVHKATLPLQTPARATYVAKRVYETTRPQPFAVGPARWLIIERLDDGAYKYYVSNLPESTPPRTVLLIGRERWKVEQGYQQLKEELGLDHFEGRSWRGLHHHIALTFVAYDFLQLLRLSREKNGNYSDPSFGPDLGECTCPQNNLPRLRQVDYMEGADLLGHELRASLPRPNVPGIARIS